MRIYRYCYLVFKNHTIYKVAYIFLFFFLGATYTFAQSNSIDSLRKVIQHQNDDTVKALATTSLINDLMRINLTQAKAEAFELLKWTPRLTDKRWMGMGYVHLVNIYQQTGQPDSAEYYLKLLQLTAERHPANTRIRINYNHSAGLFFKNQGNFRKALELMKANLPLQNKSDESRAGLLLNIGNTYIKLSDYKNAVTFHLQALKLFELLGNKRGQSFCLQSLGSDFLNLADYQEAYQYYIQSITLKEELKDKRGMISSRIGIGDVFMSLHKYDEAEKHYLTALEGAREMNLTSEEIRSNYNLGLLFQELQNGNKARIYFNETLKMATKAADSLHIRNSKVRLAGLDNTTSNEAENVLLTSLIQAKASGDRKAALSYYKMLSDYYIGTGDFDQAINYLTIHQQVKDSVESEDVLLEITKLKEQYQNEKKEKEIDLLKKDQQLQSLAFSRERSNLILTTVVLGALIVISVLLFNRYRIINRSERLLEIERMRNSIARDLHDDIGSTLSSINILSQLALKDNNPNNNYFQRINEQSSRIMESMSDIVWSINPNNDSFEQVLSKMKEFAGEILEPKNIAYSFLVDNQVKNLQLQVETRKNIFLIYKEALNNAAKYSEGANINIEIFLIDGLLSLSVADNGKGYDTVAETSGNGRRNMKERAENILGKLIQESAPGKGTKIQLEVPLT